MSIPIEPATVGISAVSGGAVILFIMKMAPILLRKMNGNSKGYNGKPGHTKICIKNSNMLAGHEVLINQLCVNQEKAEKSAEIARKENREDHKIL